MNTVIENKGLSVININNVKCNNVIIKINDNVSIITDARNLSYYYYLLKHPSMR